MLVGSDGPRLSVHSPLVEPDSAKPPTTNFATTMCFAKYSCERVLFLRAAPHHRCFRSVHTLTASTFGWGVMMLRDSDHPENWVFCYWALCHEPRKFENKRWWPSMSRFEKKWERHSLILGGTHPNGYQMTPGQRGTAYQTTKIERYRSTSGMIEAGSSHSWGTQLIV